MPTILTHMVIGSSAGLSFYGEEKPFLFWLCALISSFLPDLDIITLEFGFQYGELIGHNGLFHSILFAVVFNFALTTLIFWKLGFLSGTWFRYYLLFLCLTCLHLFLDTITSGTNGIALFSPIYNDRISFDFITFNSFPTSIKYFFGDKGLSALTSEIIYIWLPFVSLAIIIRSIKFFKQKSRSEDEDEV